MANIPTRTISDYLNNLPFASGPVGGVLTQQQTIRNDLATTTQAVPAGGTTGQLLAKTSDFDFATQWVTRTNPTYIAPRVYSVATIATLTIDAALYDMAEVTAQAGNLLVAAPSNPNTEGQRLVVRIRDNGTPRAITWSAVFSAYGATDLPNTTVVGKTLIYEFIRNIAINRWELIAGNPVPRP